MCGREGKVVGEYQHLVVDGRALTHSLWSLWLLLAEGKLLLYSAPMEGY